jgi:hypothetical protein
MEIETETVVERRVIINNVMCLLTDPDGAPLGAPMYLPQNIGPQQLQLIVNQLLHNVIITLFRFSSLFFIFWFFFTYFCSVFYYIMFVFNLFVWFNVLKT